MITREEYDKLNYWQQEKHLKRCYICQAKFNPFEVMDVGGRIYCSDECLDEFMREKD